MTNAQSIIKSQMSNFKSQGFGFQEIQPQNGLADDNLRVPTSFGIPIEQNPKSLPRRQAGQIPNPKLKSQNSKLTNKNYGGSLIAKIIGNFKLPSHRQTLATEISHHKLIGFGFLAGLLTLLGIGFFFLASFSKLTVLITPESKTVAKELTVTLDPEANSVDAIAGVLPAQEISLEQSGSRTAASTGIKLIGDSAKDQVEILNKNIKPKNTVTPNQIIKTVAEFYDIQEKAIYEHTRKTEVVKPRQVAMYLIREDLKGSYPFIGQKFGGMDHTTAIHAYEKIVRELKKDSKLDDELKSIRNKYQNIYNSDKPSLCFDRETHTLPNRQEKQTDCRQQAEKSRIPTDLSCKYQ